MKSRVSMPFWCVGNRVRDPFGGDVMDGVTSLDVCATLCRARDQGLIDYTSAHDDDMVAWDPNSPQDDLDPSSGTRKTLESLKAMLDQSKLPLKMVTCSLHGDSVFRN